MQILPRSGVSGRIGAMLVSSDRRKEGTLGLGWNRVRGSALALCVVAFAPAHAHAVWNGIVNPPSGQPDGTNQVTLQLPNEVPQTLVDEDECNLRAAETDETCPPGYDYYFLAKAGVWDPEFNVQIRYLDDLGESIGEGGGKLGADGNLNQWSDFRVRFRADWQYDTGSQANGDTAQNGSGSSTGSPSYSEWRNIDVGLQYRFQQDYFFRGLDYGFEGTYGDAGDTFYSTPDGFRPADVPPSNYWPGLEWSMGDAMDGTSLFGGDPANLFADGFESGNVTSWGEVSSRYNVDYEVKSDGWYGQQNDITQDTPTSSYIAPVTQKPRYEIGTRAGFEIPFAMKFGYVDGGIRAFAPDGSTFGSFFPSEPDREWGGLKITPRYRIGDDFTISGNYTYAVGDDVQNVTPSFDGYLPGDVLADMIAQDSGTLYVQIEICDKVLDGAGDAAPKMHVRLSPPTAADFVANPDEPRTLWHPDYDGALPIVVDADAGKSAIGAAIERLINAADTWFVASGPAAAVGANSVVGQGGTAVQTGPSPEIAVGDGDCNRSKTVIVPGGSGVNTVANPPGDGTKTRPPCDCNAQQKAFADAETALQKAEKALKDATDAHNKAKAHYETIDRQLTQSAASVLGEDLSGLEKANAEAVKAADTAYAAKKAAEKARDTAKAARDAAKKALDACKAKCPTAGSAPGGTVAPPTGPGTATDGDKDKPCDCKAKEKAVADADKAYKAAQKAAEEAKAAHDASKVEYDEMSRHAVPADKKKYDEVVKATDKAYEARKKAEQAEKDAKAALDAAKKALKACQTSCPSADGSTGGTVAPPTGPKTQTDGNDKACDCKKEQAEFDRLRKAYQDAVKESTRAEQAVTAAKEVEKAASETADEASRKAEEARSAVEADEETKRNKYAKALKTAQNRRMDFRRAEADRLATEREATDAATKAETLRKQWSAAQKALEACKKKCGQ